MVWSCTYRFSVLKLPRSSPPVFAARLGRDPCELSSKPARCSPCGKIQARWLMHTVSAFNADDFATKSDSQLRIVNQKQAPKQNIGYSGVFWLLLVNFALFLADHVLHLPWVSSLYLYHTQTRWWQYLTSAFCHGSWQHLSSNAFMLYVFGRIVEEEEGTFGVWATYCLCALGASIASILMQPPNVVSLGASGAVFGLFTVSVLLKLSFNFRKLLECVILGQFVFQQLITEAQMQSQLWAGGQGMVIAGTQVGHLAHLAGALAGVMLVLLLSRLPATDKA